jgi:hypothetical protein
VLVFAQVDVGAFHRCMYEVMSSRWTEGRTVKEVSRALSVTPKTVQRLEGLALQKLSVVPPAAELTKELYRVLLLTAISNGAPVEQIGRLCQMAKADFGTIQKMSAAEAKRHCIALRKSGY